MKKRWLKQETSLAFHYCSFESTNPTISTSRNKMKNKDCFLQSHWVLSWNHELFKKKKKQILKSYSSFLFLSHKLTLHQKKPSIFRFCHNKPSHMLIQFYLNDFYIIPRQEPCQTLCSVQFLGHCWHSVDSVYYN